MTNPHDGEIVEVHEVASVPGYWIAALHAAPNPRGYRAVLDTVEGYSREEALEAAKVAWPWVQP